MEAVPCLPDVELTAGLAAADMPELEPRVLAPACGTACTVRSAATPVDILVGAAITAAADDDAALLDEDDEAVLTAA